MGKIADTHSLTASYFCRYISFVNIVAQIKNERTIFCCIRPVRVAKVTGSGWVSICFFHILVPRFVSFYHCENKFVSAIVIQINIIRRKSALGQNYDDPLKQVKLISCSAQIMCIYVQSLVS
jgi:hypothetical protein